MTSGCNPPPWNGLIPTNSEHADRIITDMFVTNNNRDREQDDHIWQLSACRVARTMCIPSV